MAADELPLLTFSSARDFQRWLAAQPDDSPGAWLKFAKKGAPETTIGKSDAIDLALAHGWIDGRLGSIDAFFFKTRFTPRRPKSAWSMINRERAEQLIECGRMTPRGLLEIDKAKTDGRWRAAYASQSKAVPHADLQAAWIGTRARAPHSTLSMPPIATPSSIACTRRRRKKNARPRSPNC